MTPTPPPATSWMWSAGEGVNGAQIDERRQRIAWYDEVGCACGDSTTSQTFADFLARGASFSVPDEIAAEIRAAIDWLTANPPQDD